MQNQETVERTERRSPARRGAWRGRRAPERSRGAGGSVTPGDEIHLIHCLQILWRYRKSIAGLSLAAVVFTMIYSLLEPKIYNSTVTILTARESQGSGLASTLAMVSSGLFQPLPGAPFSGLHRPTDFFVGILRSRTMAEAVVGAFDLQERYRSTHPSFAIKTLQGKTTVAVSKEGIVAVTVEDEDPGLAAEIANFYARHLDEMVTGFGTTEASKKRKFIADRLKRTETDLRRAEDALRGFQETHKAFALQEQAKGIVDAAADIQAQIIASQVQLEGTRLYATEENPEVLVLKKRINELKRQLSQVQFGGGLAASPGRPPGDGPREAHVSFAEFPEISLELARLTREVRVQEAVYILLTQQLEEAKIAEARDTPTVQVLDPAVPAVRKSRPRIKHNMALAGTASLFAAILLAFGREYLKHLKRKFAEAQMGSAPFSEELPTEA